MKVQKVVKKQGQPGSDVVALVDKFATASELDLAGHLSSFQVWMYPRGDLNAWIPVLDRFDSILEEICSSYELSSIQANDFTPRTRHTLLEILRVIRLLIEHCTSRKLFSSYDRLHDLLHSNDVEVIQSSVLILLRLAQQYGANTPLENSSQIPKEMLILARGGDISASTLMRAEIIDEQSPVDVQFYPPGSSSSVSINIPNLEALHSIAEEKRMPLEDQLFASNKLRHAAATDITARRQLVSLRLNSLAAYLYLTGEDHAIFLYEPDLISQLAQVLLIDDDSVAAAALNALEACANLRAKTSDVLSALSANAGHGALITLYRSMITRERSYALLDSFYTFISFIANSQTHSHILTGAGMIPLLLEMLSTSWNRRENYIPRTTGLLEAIIFSTQQALPLFSAANGVNVLVNRINAEAQAYLDSTPPPASETLSSESITFFRTSPVKALLRMIQRLLQSAGGSEGLRNLVDSDVPKVLKKIFECADQFGPRVYSIAINLTAAFVHNEPTSLGILQEMQLPQTLYAQLEKGIPASHEVVCSIPNAIGAICLNQAGLEYTNTHSQIITDLISASSSVVPELGMDRDVGHQFGAAVDELVRHHPSLRPTVLEAVIDLLRQASGKEEALSAYLQIFKTLEGLLRNSAFCKDFVASGGLHQIFGFTGLSCAPAQFIGSDIALSMARVLRSIGEHEHVRLVESFIEPVTTAMSYSPSFLDNKDWLVMDDDHLERLQGMTNRCSLFAESLTGLSWSHSRPSTSLMRSLMSSDAFILRLGQLHRAAFTAHVLLTHQLDDVEGAEGGNDSEVKAKIMATRLHAVLTKLFKAMVKLLPGKRNADGDHLREARLMAGALSECMVGHLQPSASLPDSLSCGLDTVAVSLIVMLLFDEPGHNGHLNTVLFISFVEMGGVTKLMSTCDRLIDHMEVQHDNDASKTRATDGLQIAVSILCALASPTALLDSPQTTALLQRAQTDEDFKPVDLFIRLRYDILPLAHRMWSAGWLTQCPQMLVKKIIRAYLSIMEAEREQTSDVALTIPSSTRTNVTEANPARVDQLVDMGFDRAFAEAALRRTHNNVALATDALLIMPHVFSVGPPQESVSMPIPEPTVSEIPAESEAADSVKATSVFTRAPQQELNDKRTKYKLEMIDRALVLLDHSEDLVFDLLPALRSQTMEQILNSIAHAITENKETVISARIRLGAIMLREAQTISSNTFGRLFEIVRMLPIETSPRPRWVPAMFLLSESALEISREVVDVELGADSQAVVANFPDVSDITARLITFAQKLCVDVCSRDEFVSAMRFLVSSRSSDINVNGLLQSFKELSNKTQGCHAYLAIIVRHGFEDQWTLQQIMSKGIQQYLGPGQGLQGKVSDVTHFVRQMAPVALRDPPTFISAVEITCELVDASPPQSIYHIRSKTIPDKSSTPKSHHETEHRYAVMDLLVTEMSGIRDGKNPVRVDDQHSCSYAALVLSLITELVGSYTNAKNAFVASVRRPGLFDRGRSGMAAVLHEFVCNIDLRIDLRNSDQAPTDRLLISKWSTSLLVALCSNIVPGDCQDSSEDLSSLRRTVLDSIVKAIKDTSATDLALRYGKLWALGELIWRLLSSRSQGGRHNETVLQIAKIMLEKNYVGLLTHAAGEIDLNYPGVGAVLASLLRALEQLSKISVKWSKSDKSKTPVLPSDSEQEDSDVDMSEEDEAEHTDLYRNSALGMHGGELARPDLGEDSEDDDDEEDEMLEPFDELDPDLEEDSNTEPSSEGEAELGEGEWTDEEEEDVEGGEQEEDDDDEITLEPIHDNDDGWDDSLEPDSGTDGDDDEMHDEVLYEEDEEDEGLDEEIDFDEVDIMDTMPTGRAGDMWGWQNSQVLPARNGQRRRSRLLDATEPTAALFGHAGRSEADPAPHPLIARPVPSPTTALRHMGRAGFHEILEALEGRGVLPSTQMMDSLLGRARRHHADSMRIDISTENGVSIGLSVAHPAGLETSRMSNETGVVSPRSSIQRWAQEQAMRPYIDTQARLVAHIINRLLPEARRRVDDENQRHHDAQEVSNAAVSHSSGTDPSASTAADALSEPGRVSTAPAVGAEDVVDMPDVEMDGSRDRSESPQAMTLARTIVHIHGAEIDITDTGIDVEFLQALPDDMRADVVEQHMREQERHRRPPAVDAPPVGSQLNSEFLDALPPDIRAEVIMQEALESARRSNVGTSSPPAALVPPRNPRGFLAALDEESRDGIMTGPGSGLLDMIAGGRAGIPAKKTPNRESIQLLDRSGIASLVRLLFYPEAFHQGHLFKLLGNLCDNGVTRAELLGLLLAVIQDGSADVPAVDRSFQQMSLRALSTPKPTPKGKSADTKFHDPSVSVGNIFSQLATDHVPSFIAQRCFEALSFIVTNNPRATEFFLTEHEQSVGLKKSSTKKGKGKEKVLPQTKFPLVLLLGLLDRPLILKTPGMLESLTSLLAVITKPISQTRKDLPSELQETVGDSDPAANEPSLNIDSGPTSNSAAMTSLRTIPDAVLRLMANCLTAGECNSRTFGHTLAIMQNLSRLADGRDIILQEIRSRAQSIGLVVWEELDALRHALQESEDIANSSALAAFSSASANQAKLLRLLKTIDYLHTDKSVSGAAEVKADSTVREIYRTFDFDALWTRMGECLSVFSEAGRTDQIAVTLLPLIESLMVVCKYRLPVGRQVRSPSNPPSLQTESEDLFVTFTSVHRRILNTIVRNNPALLSGSFSLLVQNPRMLEFDNKRNWFFQKLKRRKDQVVSAGVLHLNVRRQYVFEDSYRAIGPRSGDEVKYGKLSVKFSGEEGVDAGGVTREWYSVLAQQIFDPNFALFEPCAADQQTYQPNKASAVNGDHHLGYFKFVGRVIGKAVFDGRLLDAYFSRAFYKQILGRNVDMRDLESIDPEYHKSLQWMLHNDITGVIDQEFTIEDDQFGEKKIVELKPGGTEIAVTEENKEEYVRLVVSYRLDNSIKDQIQAFLNGFYEIVPRNLVEIFEPDQLELLISGITTVDVDELKNATQLSGWKSSDPEVAWFWRALRSFSQEERSRFLMFVTSSSRVPLGGFTQLQGSSGIQPFQIQKLYADEGSLPQASTCFNLLLLPKYASYEQLRERLQFAVTETGGFGKA